MAPNTDDDTPRPLRFDTDPGESRARWLAAALVVAVVGWMGSGFVIPAEEPPAEQPVAEAERAIAVAVRQSTAQSVTRYFRAEGQALPQRTALVAAEVGGTIEAVEVAKGDRIKGGTVIARLDDTEQRAALARAEEEVRGAARDFENAQTLLDRGSGTVDRVSQARTALAQARSGLTTAQEALDAAVIEAPFEGTLEDLTVEVGEYIGAGAEAASIVDATPLTVAVQVPQQSLGGIGVGQPAEVSFITGQVVQGEVTFVGTNAATDTRTFLAEIEVANEDLAIPAGISAEVSIPVGETVAHFLSPAVLSLGSDGTLGVKTVDDANLARFHAIEIVSAQTDGIWVEGLPEEARIITVGQGFVRDGEEVAPRAADELDTSLSAEALGTGGMPSPQGGLPVEDAEADTPGRSPLNGDGGAAPGAETAPNGAASAATPAPEADPGAEDGAADAGSETDAPIDAATGTSADTSGETDAPAAEARQ
ncbi:efflux RND transporter periplasmic adaptor subunit [Mesobaculum littorinae]|uniref:efflux RND transporter periplasmic adaptor subunit n=1 Tax=Mesobaculum littorinae TaxID=2486419 RepID=UPI001F3FA097|nr:efflux RND transporter periplasmic adaptor subunit [Mesobaculum littorinae]